MKRHEFEMIAAAIREALARLYDNSEAYSGGTHVAEAIADALARGTAPGGNRAFDRELFLRNAGVTET